MAVVPIIANIRPKVVLEHGESARFRLRISESEVANGSRREVRLRPGTPFAAVSLGVVLFCCHARGDEPPRAEDGCGRSDLLASRQDS